MNSVNRIESSEIITNGKVYPSTGQLYKLSRIEVDKSCPVHGTKAILARSKSSVINSKTSKSSNKINYSPSIKLRSTTTSTHCPSPVNRAAAGKVTSHSHSERVKEADKSGYYQLDYNSKHLKSSSLSSTFPRSYTRMAFFGSIGSSQDQKLAKNMASKVDKPSPIVAKVSWTLFYSNCPTINGYFNLLPNNEKKPPLKVLNYLLPYICLPFFCVFDSFEQNSLFIFRFLW